MTERRREKKNLNTSTLFTMQKQPAVYILASKPNGTLYTGVTSDLITRIWKHQNNVFDGFTKRYNVHALVWYELHSTMESAIKKEKAIKSWPRKWKLELISEFNPSWSDLYEIVIGNESQDEDGFSGQARE
jgi:putative endonuclease